MPNNQVIDNVKFLEIHHREKIDLVEKENVNDELHHLCRLNNNVNVVHKHHLYQIRLKNG